MAGTIAYLDTSAFLKLVLVEPETDALWRWLLRWPGRASAALLRTEALRAVRREGMDHLVGPARRLVAAVHLIEMDARLLDRAADLAPRTLRSLDAIHLAAALDLGADLGAMACYDERLAQAARDHGLVVESPR